VGNDDLCLKGSVAFLDGQIEGYSGALNTSKASFEQLGDSAMRSFNWLL
jgi:hypothetical protein